MGVARLVGVGEFATLVSQAVEGFLRRIHATQERLHLGKQTHGRVRDGVHAPARHVDLHGAQVVVGRSLEVRHRLDLLGTREAHCRQACKPHEEELGKVHVGLVDPCRVQGIEVEHAQLDVARVARAQRVEAIGAARLHAHGIIELAGLTNEPLVNVCLDARGVGRDARVVQDGRELVPISQLTAAHAPHAQVEVVAEECLLGIGRIEQRARGRHGGHNPAKSHGLLRQVEVERILVSSNVSLTGCSTVRLKQRIGKREVEVDAAEHHLVAPIAVGKVLAVDRLLGLLVAELRDGNVVLASDVGRVRKRPEQLGGLHGSKRALLNRVVASKLGHACLRAPRDARVDLALYLGEVSHDVTVAAEGVGRLGEEPFGCHAQVLALQPEIALEEVRPHILVVHMQHRNGPLCTCATPRRAKNGACLRFKSNPPSIQSKAFNVLPARWLADFQATLTSQIKTQTRPLF